jgi:EmrB/QacA subfamily drug resistance transporter
MGESGNKYLVLFVTTMASFISSLNMTAVNVAIPAIGNEFGMSAAMLGWVAIAIGLVNASIVIPFGRLADLYGRMKILKIGLILSTVTYFLCTIVPSGNLFIVIRGMQGIGVAMITGTSMSIVSLVFPDEKRGRALGIIITAAYFGRASGPPLGGFLTAYFGWRGVFYLFSAVSLALIVLASWKVKRDWVEAKGQHYDKIGAVLIAISIALVMYGFPKVPSTPAIGFIVLGLIGLVAFFRWEIHITEPILNVTLLKSNRVFILSILACLMNYALLGAFALLSNLYMQYVKGWSPQFAGIVLLAYTLIMALVANLGGQLSDKFSPQKVATIGLVLNGTSAVFFATHNQTTSLFLIVSSLVLIGVGQGIFAVPNTKLVIGAVGRDAVSVATATLGATRTIGSGFGAGIAIVLFKVYMGDARIAAENLAQFLSSMRMTFIIVAVLCTVGIICEVVGSTQPAETRLRSLK